jgi:predicted Zn-dependent peptidase
MAYHVPNLLSPDASALEVLSAILAGGDSARLHDELVYRSRLARSVGVSYDYTSIDPGLFLVYSQPLPGKTAAQSEAAMSRELDRLRREPPTAREMEKAKNGIESSFVFRAGLALLSGHAARRVRAVRRLAPHRRLPARGRAVTPTTSGASPRPT